MGEESVRDVIECPNCPTSPFRVISHQPLYTLRQCTGCGLVFRDRRAAAGLAEKTDGVLRHLVSDEVSRCEARTLLDLVHRLRKPPGQLLDIGCGLGSLLALAKDLGWSTMGMDREEWSIEFARQRGLSAEVGAFDALPFAPDSFDVILVRTLPSILAPAALFEACWALLRRDGVLAVTLPNYGSLTARLTPARWQGRCSPEDVWCYSSRPLDLLLRRNGFVPITWTTTRDWRHDGSSPPERFFKVISWLANWLNRGETLNVAARLGWPE